MKEKNMRMTVFKAIGIIVVVSCHLEENLFNIIGIPLTISRELFPEYSYHIPLFVFASGYFYKRIYENDYIALFKKRFKTITKYYKSNAFYFLLCFILVNMGILHREIHFTLFSMFIEPFLGGFQFYFNGPGWFVPFLFTVRVTYPLLRKFISLFRKSFKPEEERNFKDEAVFTVFLCIAGIVAAHLSNLNPVKNDVVTPYHAVLRTIWGLQYMQIGLFFKEYLEKHISYTKGCFLLLLIVKTLFYFLFGYRTFSLRTVSFHGDTLICLFTSLIGILYILYLSEFICKIASKLPDMVIKFINFTGDNTWSVMIHHLFIKWLITLSIDAGIWGSATFFVSYVARPVLCLALPLIFVFICNKVNDKRNKIKSDKIKSSDAVTA